MEQSNTEVPNSPPPVNNLPPSPQLKTKSQSNSPLILGGIILLSLFTLGGVILGKYLFAPQFTVIQPTLTPKPTLFSTPTPIPDPTTNWKKYTNTVMGIEFRYPVDPKWNIVEKTQGDNSLTIYNYDVGKAPGRSYAPSIDKDLFKIEISIQKSAPDANQWFDQQKTIIDPITNKPNEFSNIKTITVDSQKGVYYEVKDNLSGITVGNTVFNDPNGRLVFFFGGLNFEGNRQVFNQILSTFKFFDQPQTDVTINWQTFTSQCGLTVKHPQQWKAQTSFLPNVPKSGDPNYNYDCAYITAPDYIQGTDSRDGLYISLIGTTIGTTFKPVDTKISPYPINTIDDYIKSVEDSVITQPEPFKAKNVQTKTYGSITGKYFETAAMEERASFVFIKRNTIFNISWPKNYNGQYKNNIESIINSAQ